MRLDLLELIVVLTMGLVFYLCLIITPVRSDDRTTVGYVVLQEFTYVERNSSTTKFLRPVSPVYSYLCRVGKPSCCQHLSDMSKYLTTKEKKNVKCKPINRKINSFPLK